MNADNVKPYGKLVHDAAKAGGVDKFCDTIEQIGYLKGASDKQDELMPYLIATGILAITEGVIICYYFIKDKLEQRAYKKANLEKKAQQARDNLADIFIKNVKEGDLHEEQKIIDEYTGEQDDIS